MLKKIILISGIWSYTNIIFTALNLTLIALIFSRFLTVSDYGSYVSANLIIEFLSNIGGLGVSAFLIQREKIDNKIISVCFLLISLLSLLLILILNTTYFLDLNSPNISEIFFISRILSWNILSKNLLSVINAIWFRELKNKPITQISIISGFISFLLVIFLTSSIDPFKALLIFTISQPIIQLIISLRLIKFKLFLVYDFLIIKEIFDYGIPIVFTRLIGYLNLNSPKIVCSIFLGNYELGILSSAILITESIHRIFFSSMWSIWMPLLGKIRREAPIRFGEFYLRLRTIQAATIIPILLLLFWMRRPLLTYLLPERFYQIESLLPGLIFAGLFLSMNYLFRPTLILIGKTRQRLKFDLLRLILSFMFLIPLSNLGIIYITFALVLIELILFLISQYLLKDIIKKSLFQQFYPLRGTFIAVLVTSIIYCGTAIFLNYDFNLFSFIFYSLFILITYVFIVFKIDKSLMFEIRDLTKILFKDSKVIDS